jgi:hypothetical protein
MPSPSACHTSMSAPGTAFPSVSVTVPSTQHGWPGASPAMSPPMGTSGEFLAKNVPITVASVASAQISLLTLIVCMDAPSTSESSTYSWRRVVVICPAAVRKPMACCHSCSLRRTSVMNACTDRTSACISSFRRGLAVLPKDARTAATSSFSTCHCRCETAGVAVRAVSGAWRVPSCEYLLRVSGTIQIIAPASRRPLPRRSRRSTHCAPADRLAPGPRRAPAAPARQEGGCSPPGRG